MGSCSLSPIEGVRSFFSLTAMDSKDEKSLITEDYPAVGYGNKNAEGWRREGETTGWGLRPQVGLGLFSDSLARRSLRLLTSQLNTRARLT